ncbi:sigma-70 family RNA polymerase sigma factor [Actinoplanes sp. CA-131856]
MEKDAESRIAELHAAHHRPLMRFLLGYTNGEQHAAEDLLQETMIRAWRNLHKVPDEHQGARRWLFTVARRITIDAVRMRRARPEEAYLSDLIRTPATDNTAGVVADDALTRALRDLSDGHRAVLSELHLHGRTAPEAARRLGLPLGTVKSRSHYAMRAVRDAVLP